MNATQFALHGLALGDAECHIKQAGWPDYLGDAMEYMGLRPAKLKSTSQPGVIARPSAVSRAMHPYPRGGPQDPENNLAKILKNTHGAAEKTFIQNHPTAKVPLADARNWGQVFGPNYTNEQGIGPLVNPKFGEYPETSLRYYGRANDFKSLLRSAVERPGIARYRDNLLARSEAARKANPMDIIRDMGRTLSPASPAPALPRRPSSINMADIMSMGQTLKPAR